MEVRVAGGASQTPQALSTRLMNRFGTTEEQAAMPGNLKGAALENFICDAASTYWHQTCTAKMGHDAMSVVDGSLKVHGIDHLRIADGSIMPHVTTGNTMAPCVVIGERAGEILMIANGV
jgi:choline dehydrogenase